MILDLQSQMLSRLAIRFLPMKHTTVDDALVIAIRLVFFDSKRP